MHTTGATWDGGAWVQDCLAWTGPTGGCGWDIFAPTHMGCKARVGRRSTVDTGDAGDTPVHIHSLLQEGNVLLDHGAWDVYGL